MRGEFRLRRLEDGEHGCGATEMEKATAVGGDETSEFLRQAQLLWDAWPRNRPPGDAGPLVLPGRHHFSVVFDYADADAALTRRTLSLF